MPVLGTFQYLEDASALLNGSPVQDQMPEETVLQYGKRYDAVAVDLPEWMSRGQVGKCFDESALRAAMHRDRGVKYVEGFAMMPGMAFPVLHAWNLDADGTVLDSTWRGPGDYFGIEMPIEFVAAFMKKTKYQGVLANRFRAKKMVDQYFKDLKK